MPGPAADARGADAVSASAEAPPPRGEAIALVYSSNDGAEYERCGCPVHPLGGLARRAAEVDKIRAESDGVVSVDAGDLFLPVEEPRAGARPPTASEVERRARLLAAAYARLGVTAFSPGERDLALGAPLLARVLADAKVPVVSANLVDLRGRPLFAADRLVDVAGVKFGIFGVTAVAPSDPKRAAPAPPDPARLRAWGVQVRDPVAAARAEVASLRARGARVVVALVHVGGAPDNRKLVAAVPGVDWAVLGHSGLNLETPERAATPGDARLLEAMSLGRNLGRLDLHVVAGDGPFVDRGARGQLEAILADHRQQVADYEQRLPTTKNQPTLNDYYAKRLVALGAAIARETRALAVTPARVTGNWFDNRIIPLDALVPDQPGVAALVAAYNRDSDRLAAAGKPVGVSARVPGAPAPPAHLTPAAGAPAPTATYVGTTACVSCHRSAAEFWRATKHARALETLERAHRARSPACVGCHVTGYLQPGGTDDVEVATTRLRDVGCESCHGAGSAHAAAPNAPGKIARDVGAFVCLGCHTPDQTNAGFDEAAFRGAIIGPGHGAPAP
ncbi:MAG TPA: multiheme c-type cytochrome [Polyangia bacterium]|nr:multiheme c-type cytochrome [Polyangia bacterium]